MEGSIEACCTQEGRERWKTAGKEQEREEGREIGTEEGQLRERGVGNEEQREGGWL